MSEINGRFTYTKARFFKCALQVNSAGYIKYRGEQQTLSEDDYNQQLLSAALEVGIEVVGLADHGSVDNVDKLRSLFTQNNIVAFPGFEIASSEKIHFVCLFDESTLTDQLKTASWRFRCRYKQSRISSTKICDRNYQLY